MFAERIICCVSSTDCSNLRTAKLFDLDDVVCVAGGQIDELQVVAADGCGQSA